MTTFTPAPDAARIGADLVGRHHTDLADVRIEYVYRDKHTTSGGRKIAGKARKMTGLNAFLARAVTSQVDHDDGDPFFLIEIADDLWKEMGPSARKALVDHELCHCAAEFDEEKDRWVLSIVGHDVAEFTEIVERHGAWDEGLKEFAQALHTQLDMFTDGDEGGDGGDPELAAAHEAGEHTELVDGCAACAEEHRLAEAGE